MKTLAISAALLLGIASPAFAYGYVPYRPSHASTRAPLKGEYAYAMVPRSGAREPDGDSVRSFSPALAGGGSQGYNAGIDLY